MGAVYSKRTPCTFDDSLYIGDDVLSAANEVLMENILMHLELKDLLVLSMTSKKMKEHVRKTCRKHMAFVQKVCRKTWEL